MAQETGGRAIVNRNDTLAALEEAASDFRSFYSLGISSSGTDSARYHRIEVRLRGGEARKGVTLRHRAGYRSKSAETRIRESLRSALLYDHQSNPLGLEMTVGTAERDAESGLYVVPIQLRVPLPLKSSLGQWASRSPLRSKLTTAIDAPMPRAFSDTSSRAKSRATRVWEAPGTGRIQRAA